MWMTSRKWTTGRLILPKGVGLPLFVSAENIASSLLEYSCEYERKEYYNNGIGSDIADRL